MKAVVYRGVGDIRIEQVPEPTITCSTDAIVRLKASAICGTDLHFIRGTVPGLRPGSILGHEGIGIVEELGSDVRNLRLGDRVVIASTIACGSCVYCRDGYFSQCDRANPNGPRAGTAFFGGPESAGGFPGMQAEMVRVPFAHVGLVRLPDDVSDDQAIMLSDIAPTGYFGAELAEITVGDIVAVFGCGPVGQFAIACAKLRSAARVLAIDTIPDRLAMAREQGAEVIDFNAEDPVQALVRLTDGSGPDRIIDAVGIDADRASNGPAAAQAREQAQRFRQQVSDISQDQADPQRSEWRAGDAPSQVLEWAVEAIAKAGTLAIIGLYPLTASTFPIGLALQKNLTIKGGNCPHRRYIPKLISLIQAGSLRPERILTRHEHLPGALAAYHAFDRREPGWVKVELATMPKA